MPPHALDTLPLVMLACPATMLFVLGGASILDRPLPERAAARLTRVSMSVATLASLAALGHELLTSRGPRILDLGAWFTGLGGHFTIQLLLDRTSLGFAALTISICGVVAAFSTRYLHREPGRNRYFVLFSLFVLGMLLVGLAGSMQVLFAGWEMIGVSSALLVAFFHERPMPVRNALRVFAVYRVSDTAMLSAAVLLPHFAGSGSLALLFGASGRSLPALTDGEATIIGLLFLMAVAGKSALLPFSGWLPRAMEGPTPSSAVYYGALSVHAGCYLLLRAAPLLEQAPLVRLVAGVLGIGTALFATLATRVQFDVKSSLAFSSLTQVGLIIAEIALGLYGFAFVHLTSHACLRLLQVLRAPNVLQDFRVLRDAVGEPFAPTGRHLERILPPRLRLWLYRFALERAYLDVTLDRCVVAPFERVAHAMDSLDRRFCGWLVAKVSRSDGKRLAR